MFRFAVLLIVICLAFASDQLADVHHRAVQHVVSDSGSVVMRYEKPEIIHGFHHFELWLLAILFLVGVLCMIPESFITESFQMLWTILLIVVVLSAAGCLLFEAVSDGAEGQYGIVMSFWESERPAMLVELASIACCILLISVGAPEAWSPRKQTVRGVC